MTAIIDSVVPCEVIEIRSEGLALMLSLSSRSRKVIVFHGGSMILTAAFGVERSNTSIAIGHKKLRLARGR
jgi:hypothetical protein